MRLHDLWYSRRRAWTHGFNAKIGSVIYAPRPEILAKMYTTLAFQAKCQKYLTFLPISQDSVAYLGILVTRKYLRWQKILSKSTPLCQNFKKFLWFSSKSNKIFQHFLPKYQNSAKTGNIFSQIKQEIQSKEKYFADLFCKFRLDTRMVRITCRYALYTVHSFRYHITRTGQNTFMFC